MKNTLKRITSAAMALLMAIGIGTTAASAAGPYKDGNYTGKVLFMHESQDKNSMCNSLFDQDADIKVTGENAEIRLYTAYPVPSFSSVGADGTVKDVVLTIDGKNYTAVSDITTKPVREFDEAGPMFGITPGQSLPTQVLTLTIPADKLDSLANATPAKAFVNVVMMSNVNFRFKLSNITAVQPEPVPDETKTQGMQITAAVAAPTATYAVTIPETVTLGTLSSDKDNVVDYKVEITAENMGAGYVEVSAPSSGVLKNADNELAYTNSFGTQKTSSTGTLNGQFTVSAAGVASAAAGNYTGSATFTISYFAG